MKQLTNEAPQAKARRAPLVLTLVVAVGVVAALALFASTPWATVPPQQQRPVPVQWPAVVAPAPLGAAVDWSLVEASENPGPPAIAAYGP